MENESLRDLTASERLSLDEEYEMQSTSRVIRLSDTLHPNADVKI